MKRSFKSPRSKSAIKVLASKLRKSNPSVTQSQALEHCSIEAGFSNWKHACKALPEVMPLLRISSAWNSGLDGTAGIESLAYPFPWTALEVIGDPNDEGLSYLGAGLTDYCTLKADALNTIQCMSVPTQQLARNVVARTLRELMVRDATSFAQLYEPGDAADRFDSLWGINAIQASRSFPGSKYFTCWKDPQTQAVVIFDEPIVSDVDPVLLLKARTNWCAQHGYRMLETMWAGTLSKSLPSILLTKVENDIDLCLTKALIEALPDDFSGLNWKGESESLQFIPRVKHSSAGVW